MKRRAQNTNEEHYSIKQKEELCKENLGPKTMATVTAGRHYIQSHRVTTESNFSRWHSCAVHLTKTKVVVGARRAPISHKVTVSTKSHREGVDKIICQLLYEKEKQTWSMTTLNREKN